MHTKTVKNKYRVSYKYTYTHTIKITKIILGEGITDWKLNFYTLTILTDIAPYYKGEYFEEENEKKEI